MNIEQAEAQALQERIEAMRAHPGVISVSDPVVDEDGVANVEVLLEKPAEFIEVNFTITKDGLLP